MQRTPPPPMCSMVGIAAGITVACDSSARRCAGSRLPRPWSTSAMSGRRRRQAPAHCRRNPASAAGRCRRCRGPVARSLQSTALAVLRLADRLAADHGKAGADRHHHIGVIDGLRRRADGLEGHQLVVQQLREFAEHIQIGARRQAGVGHAVRAVQDHAARALEKFSLRLAMRQIDGARNAESALPHHLFEDVLAPLPAPVGRQHRIQRHGAVVMKAHPVVREISHPASPAAACRERSALPRRRAPGPAPGRRIRAGPVPVRLDSRPSSQDLLEGIAGGGLRIESETGRPHHEHGRGALRFLARMIGGDIATRLYQRPIGNILSSSHGGFRGLPCRYRLPINCGCWH